MRNQQRLVTTYIAEARKVLDASDKEKDKELLKEAGLKLFRAHRGLPRYKALVKFLSEPGIKSEMLKTGSLLHARQEQEHAPCR